MDYTMIDIYMCKINSENLISSNSVLLNYVSDQKKQKIKNHRNSILSSQSLVGEILVRISICSNLQIPNNKVIFHTNEYKKPLLKYPPGYFSNISHSGDWVVSAFCQKPVGVDIEHIKRIDYEGAQDFFAYKEFSLLMNKEVSKRLTYFFEVWTLKESYVKAIGKGLTYPLNKFCITYDGCKFYINDESIKAKASFQQFTVDERHIMSICAFSSMNSSIRVVSLQQLEYLVPQLNNPEALLKCMKELDLSVSVYESEGKFSL
ncbi:4'-phosphopantetheinyl transferase superfamily protein [Bacillus cereus]|nr:4'-phosphopantetheinyl transferase superfamily protein [Bacillus cereus]